MHNSKRGIRQILRPKTPGKLALCILWVLGSSHRLGYVFQNFGTSLGIGFYDFGKSSGELFRNFDINRFLKQKCAYLGAGALREHAVSRSFSKWKGISHGQQRQRI